LSNAEIKDAVIGFVDGSSQYTNVNTSRLWSFKKLRIRKNTGKSEKVNSFGFYALNGNSVYSTKESSKKEKIAKFLQEIRRKNRWRKIVVIWDNFKSHKSKLVNETAKKLGIILVFLPPYSPDLNPIEFIWKSIKKELSSKFLMRKEEVKETVEKLFYKLSSSLSFAKAWIEKFITPLQIKLA